MFIRLNTILLKTLCALALFSFAITTSAQPLLPNYNSTFYPDVLSAAVGVAEPFLYQQKYTTQSGVTVDDTVLVYNGTYYDIFDNYMNPGTGYYMNPFVYSSYGIQDFQTIWPLQIPNVLFNSNYYLFNGTVDCVGYGTRLLSAVGDTTTEANAYLNLINTINSQNFTHFAHKGYVATAYEFAVAFPTLPTSVTTGWQYIAGNVEDSLINAYNHTIQSSLSTYNGVRKGAFAQAQAGDVVAFGYSAASSSNGHFVILEKQPQQLNYDSLYSYLPAQNPANLNALLAAYNVYAMPVYDCSGLMAHFRDSRTQMSGIGHGTLIMLTDTADDAPVGYIFDTLEVEGNTINYDSIGSHVYAISVGRFVTEATAVNQIAPETVLSIYPNPTEGLLHITWGSATGTLEIYNVLGQKILSRELTDQQTTVDMSGFAAGIYQFRILNHADILYTGKVVKQ